MSHHKAARKAFPSCPHLQMLAWLSAPISGCTRSPCMHPLDLCLISTSPLECSDKERQTLVRYSSAKDSSSQIHADGGISCQQKGLHWKPNAQNCLCWEQETARSHSHTSTEPEGQQDEHQLCSSKASHSHPRLLSCSHDVPHLGCHHRKERGHQPKKRGQRACCCDCSPCQQDTPPPSVLNPSCSSSCPAPAQDSCIHPTPCSRSIPLGHYLDHPLCALFPSYFLLIHKCTS